VLLADILRSGESLGIVLLAELPDQTDLLHTPRIVLVASKTLAAVPTILDDSDNVLAELTADVEGVCLADGVCVAVAIMWGGQCVAVAWCLPEYFVAGRVSKRLTVRVQVGPWEG
jgi:hypothetical protein